MKTYNNLWKAVMAVTFFFIIVAAPGRVLGTPYFSLDTLDDWNSAPISPVTSNYDAATEHYGTEGTDYVFTTPELYVYEGDPSDPPVSDAGLVMYWGDPGTDLPQLASWEYTYPQDPNLVGTKLNLTVMPPIGIWSVSLTLNDSAGGWVSWDWNVNTPGNPLGAGSINPGTPYTITIDPTVLGPQAGSNSFALNQAVGFDPTKATSIQADELAMNPGPGGIGWQQFPAVPVVGGAKPWNYWSNLSVVPEPVSSILFVAGGATLGFRRFRRKRRIS